jgi:ribulose 1,5-bisphosphate carboxylase large subunit-like protein
MEVTQELAEKLVAENARIAQDQEIYRNKYDALSARHEAAVAAHDRIQATIQERTAKAESITAFLHTMKKRESLMEEFDEKNWTGFSTCQSKRKRNLICVLQRHGNHCTLRCV